MSYHLRTDQLRVINLNTTRVEVRLSEEQVFAALSSWAREQVGFKLVQDRGLPAVRRDGTEWVIWQEVTETQP